MIGWLVGVLSRLWSRGDSEAPLRFEQSALDESGLVAAAVGEFLDGLGRERDLDAPLLAMLRLQGYDDIALVHGSYEFGKDIIATRRIDGVRHQFLFQSKRGNITKSVWDKELQPQCDQCIYTGIAHPLFDTRAPRVVVVVCSGRLRGEVQVLAQQLDLHFRNRCHGRLEVWDREKLVSLISASACIGRSFDWAQFGHFLRECESGDVNPSVAESFTQRWRIRANEGAVWRVVLEHSIVSRALESRGLGFHAFRLQLGLLRSLCYFTFDCSPTPAIETLEELIREELRMRACSILQWHSGTSSKELKLEISSPPNVGVVMASSRLLLLGEIVALDVLAGGLDGGEKKKAASFLRTILTTDASTKPLSDEYAVSILTIATAAAALGEQVDDWLQRNAAWVREAYSGDNAAGLAAPSSRPSEELWRTVGAVIDHPRHPPRRETVLGPAILDACSVLEMEAAYTLCHRSLTKRDALVPERLLPGDMLQQFETGGHGCIRVMGGEYPPDWLGLDGWKNGTPHSRQDQPRMFDERGRSWIGVGLSLLLRDRWWLHSYRRVFLEQRATPRDSNQG